MKSLKDMTEKDKDDQQKSPVAQFIPQKAGLFPTSAGLNFTENLRLDLSACVYNIDFIDERSR